MLKIRRPLGRLIFNMGIAIPGKTVFLIETAPWLWHPYTAVLKAPGYDILTQQCWKPLVMTSLHSSFESPWLWHPYMADYTLCSTSNGSHPELNVSRVEYKGRKIGKWVFWSTHKWLQMALECAIMISCPGNTYHITGSLCGESTSNWPQHKGPGMWLWHFFMIAWAKQSSCQWFQMPWFSCDVPVMLKFREEI